MSAGPGLRPDQNTTPHRPSVDYRALFEAGPGLNVVVLADAPQFTIEAANDTWLESIGMSREEAIGRSLFEAVPAGPDPTHATTLENLRASFCRVLNTEQPDTMSVQRYDLPRPESEGGGLEARYWSPVNSAVRGAAGKVTHILHRVEDVTAQSRSEEQLRQATDRLEGAHAAAELGIWTWDVQADHLIADRNLAFLFGVDERAAAGGLPAETFILRVHPDDQAFIRERLAYALERGEAYAVEYRVFGADGVERWIASRGRAKLDAQGEPQWLNGVVLDVTERKRAEEALRQSEERRGQLLQQIAAERERLQQVFAQAPVAVAVLQGRELIFALANPSYQEFLPGRELLGRPLTAAMPEVSPELLAILHRVLDTGEPFVGYEYRVPLKRDGVLEDHWFTFVYQPWRQLDGSVVGIVVVAVDVARHVRARQQLEQANKELEEFAYVASHDLQEPLRMVNIYSQLLTKRFGSGAPEAEQYAHFVQQGVRRMETLIKDLLTYSRTVQREELPIGCADLSAALSEALSVLQTRMAENGAVITYELLPKVRGDTKQLAHVFQNLLSNALKYRNADGATQIRITAEQQGEQWIIAVRDNGIGFEQTHAERIFGLFKRLHKDEYPGTGLGLAICQRIVERYGGRMWAEGRPNEGAVFFFSLAAADSE